MPHSSILNLRRAGDPPARNLCGPLCKIVLRFTDCHVEPAQLQQLWDDYWHAQRQPPATRLN